MKHISLTAVVFATVSTLQAQSVMAQESEKTIEKPRNSGNEIVVTARRREESLSKVPIAISALSSEALAERSIQSESDLQSAVPGLTVRQTGGNNIINFSIRGQSIDAYTNSPPAVLPYVNEFQVVSYSASSFFDLENIQVLKGPQGTLFGRNTTGGAVLYQTARPGDEFEGYVSGRIGNYGAVKTEFGVTVPMGEVASLRLAGNYSDGGGYVTNLFNGKKLGDNENKSIRGTLLLQPSSAIRNTLTVQYSRDKGTNIPNLLYSVNACGSVDSDGSPLVDFTDCAFGLSPTYLDYQNQLGIKQVNLNSSLRHSAKGWYAINTTEIDLSPSLTVKNIIGWNKSSKDDVYDFDGTFYPIYENQEVGPGQKQDTRQFSEEIQLQGTLFDDSLNFVAGLFYSNQTDGLISNGLFFGVSPVYYSFALNTKSKAVFAQATYNITEDVHLTGGLRYSEDKIVGQNRPGSVFGITRQEVKYDRPSWTVSIDYQATPELLLYATHRGSWRAGGLNFTSIPINQTAAAGGNIFLPERTKDIELGAKFNGWVADVPVTLVLDVYKQWVDDVQRANNQLLGGNPALFTSNVPKAEIIGFEGSFSVKPTDWLEMGVSGTYTDAKFTEADAIVFGNLAHYGPYADVAKWTGAFYTQATYALPGDTGTLLLRGDVYGQTGVYFSNLADTVAPDTRLPGYSIVNFKLNLQDIGGSGITVGFYMKNVFDKKYFAGGLPTSSGFGLNTVSAGTPRTFGGEMRFEF